MDQKTKVEADQCDQYNKYFQLSKPLWLSQIIKIRLNQPRQDELSQIIQHKKMVRDGGQRRHLIKAIQLQEGNATLNNVTEPYLPFLRKQNGKNFTGLATRTVKGCLSAVVFKRNDESTWSVDETKVEEFIRQANRKLYQFLEKLKKNFLIYDYIKMESYDKKIKKRNKMEQKRNEDQFIEKFLPYLNQKLDSQYNIKIENHYQNFDQNGNSKLNFNWHYSISDNIFRNLYFLRQGEKIDDQFLGNLIGFYNIKDQLERMKECQRFID
ncbi:unnamed protein product [Paramecium primaurelia]|uniref:Uncharacterized protein n=1 Tax=Paramecium primaurelia TaxID=5886 RepID=A0A8S1Q1W1_PARPR|nr:unnamed protein product [Paramecium primaurelia]